MKVWIDGQCLQTASRQRGIGRYVQEFIRAISDPGFELELIISFNAAMLDEAIAARDYIQQWIQPRNIHVWEGVAEGGEAALGYTEKRRLSEIAIAHHVACLRPDIALSASPFEGVNDRAVPLNPEFAHGIPTASIFYDAIPHRFAEQYLSSPLLHSSYYRRLAFFKEFDLNLCISEYSKREAIDLSGNTSSVNISAGLSIDFSNLLLSNESEARFTFRNSKSVVYVGGLDWRKNVVGLVDAFAALPDHLRNQLKLVIAGDFPPDRIAEVKARWDSHKLSLSNFISLGHVSDRELVHLYKSAHLVVQPSLLEGFGLTVLEAMSCGTPVVGSATGALPEVLVDPEAMFDPTDPQSIADRIAKAFLDHGFRTKLGSEGLERAKLFTWSNSAKLGVAAMRQKIRNCERTSNAFTLESIRHRTVTSLYNRPLPPDLFAETLARAEPVTTSSDLFFIDATSTVQTDHGTGIQRVTKQIVSKILLQDFEKKCFAIHGDDKDGFLEIKIDPNVFSSAETTAKTIHFRGGDTVLMLDSSWHFHHHHLPQLVSARLRGASVISCLYDTVPLRFEAMCHPGIPPIFVAWLKSALSYSTGFVCISKAVADEFYALLEGVRFPRPMKIGFWHLGSDFSSDLPSQFPRKAEDVRKRFRFLMVGTVEPRKGHRIALDAFEMLWAQGYEFDLVIVGKPGWDNDHLINRLRNHPKSGSNLYWHEEVNDDELRGFYAECDALVAASYTEGFGLPLVEARYFGKPVIAADIPVFREICERAQFTQFFEPGSSSSLASAVREFWNMRKDGDKSGETSHWMNWAESAVQLKKVVLENNWYRIYQPPSSKQYESIFNYGVTMMERPVSIEGRRHRIELIEGPTPSAAGQKLAYVMRVTNLSDQVWSSTSASGCACGIFLSYRIFNKEGFELVSENRRFGIPFVLTPGDSHFMKIEIETNSKMVDASILSVEMFQEPSTWFGNALRLKL